MYKFKHSPYFIRILCTEIRTEIIGHPSQQRLPCITTQGNSFQAFTICRLDCRHMENWEEEKIKLMLFIHIPFHKSQFPVKASNKSTEIKHVEDKKCNFGTYF